MLEPQGTGKARNHRGVKTNQTVKQVRYEINWRKDRGKQS